MSIDLGQLIDEVAAQIIAATEELTRLDSAIGDADHGANMKRGFEAVLASRASILAKPLPEAIQTIGLTLVMKVGGASGPLYGTLLMILGKELPAEPAVSDLAIALARAVDAVKVRGKADIGNKTMLDVLSPVEVELSTGAATFDSVRRAAARGALATVAMKAIRGRASFLGERSRGHMDPGARSSQIIIESIANCLENRA
jgi:dihydroxyacetone kinase-like protein